MTKLDALLNLIGEQGIAIYIYLLGAYSETEVTGDLMKAILNCSGEEDLAWCQTFKRALVNGEVYHSKSYGRVFRRNSYSDL